MTDPVLSQLMTVESDLTEQVEQIEAQLSQLKTKRQGLRTVIDLFGEDGAEASAAAQAMTAAADIEAGGSSASSSQAATKTAKSTTTKSTAKTKAGSAQSKSRAKNRTTTTTKSAAKSGRKTKAKSAGRTAGRKKKDGRAAAWQKHVQSPYRDLALPESVSSVLQSQPSEIFTIAEVMSGIFREDMPRTAYLKARNRISNILSAGARDGTWYRGRNGRYSQSEKVTKIK